MAKTENVGFFTLFNLPVGDGCPTGTRFDKTYEMSIDSNGHKVLKHSGETDRYAKIQAHKEETLIENILKRATLDPSILQQRAGQYGDFTDAPKTLAEAQNMMIALENTFKDLPLEVREQFDHSLEKFISEAGSPKWIEIMMPKKNEDPVVKVEDEKGEVK